MEDLERDPVGALSCGQVSYRFVALLLSSIHCANAEPPARWAVKEAAYKALYPALRPTWKQLSFRPGDSDVKPILKLEKSTIVLHSSVSHDGEYVVAYVLAESIL